MSFYPNGIGGTIGDALATCKPLIMSGSVWYVHSSTGTDAASPTGLQRERPLATLAQAHTNAAAGDTIVCLSGHTEVLTATQTFNKAGITLVGEGLSGGLPAVTFSKNGSNIMFAVSAAGVSIRHIRVAASPAAGLAARISWSGAAGELRGCYIEGGANDTVNPGLDVVTGADRLRVRSTTFVSTTASSGSRPRGLVVANAVSDLELLDCVFDGGQYGFSGPSGDVGFDAGLAVTTRLRIESLSLLRGADYIINAGSVYYLNPQTTTGGSRGTP